MLFGIDIDETIAQAETKESLVATRHYYRSRGVTIPEQANYPSFLCHPDIIPFHRPIKQAVEGVRYLAQKGRVGYYTVRKYPDVEVGSRIPLATRAWLTDHNFPAPSSVTFCQSVIDKLVQMEVQETPSAPEPYVLIDDRWHKAVEHFHLICSYDAALAETIKQRLIIFAYGTQEVSLTATNGLKIVALPSWEHIESVVAQSLKSLI